MKQVILGICFTNTMCEKQCPMVHTEFGKEMQLFNVKSFCQMPGIFPSKCPSLLQLNPQTFLIMFYWNHSHFLLFNGEDSENISSFWVKVTVGKIHTYKEHHEIYFQHIWKINRYVGGQHSGVRANWFKIRQRLIDGKCFSKNTQRINWQPQCLTEPCQDIIGNS